MRKFTEESVGAIQQELFHDMGWTVSMDPSTQVPGTFWVDAVSEDLLQRVTAYLIISGYGVSGSTTAKSIISEITSRKTTQFRQYFTQGLNQ